MDKPDYAFWGNQPEYNLNDAAHLCCDMEPQRWELHDIPRKLDAMARRIRAEVPCSRDTSQTTHSPNYGGGKPLPVHIPGDQFYSFDGLREWAERTGQREAMPFLFPEDRTTQLEPQASQKPTKEPGTVTTREEPAVLDILGALLKLKYGDGIFRRLGIPDGKAGNGEFDRVYEDIAKHIKISPECLRGYLKRIPS